MAESGGAAARRAAEVRPRQLVQLGFARRGGGYVVDRTEGAGRQLYRAAEGP
jgi:hypothetical protein